MNSILCFIGMPIFVIIIVFAFACGIVGDISIKEAIRLFFAFLIFILALAGIIWIFMEGLLCQILKKQN